MGAEPVVSAAALGEPELLNEAGSEKRKVLILYTGGTMGMQDRGDGTLACKPGALANQLRLIEELAVKRMPQCWLVEFNPLLDSADMCPTDWNCIAAAIHDRYYEYDGFVIIHGTDTLAYTASALSFMLEQLAKPIVLTGSQVPFFAPMSDARQNFLGAVVFAGLADICEVCVFFGNRLLRGNRASKVNAVALQAFESPSFPSLADVGVEINLYQNRLRPAPTGRFRLQEITVRDIMVVWVIPGFSDRIFEPILENATLRGMVLLLYGCGNAPARKESFLRYLRKIVAKGVVVVACSQCSQGTVSLEKYAVGKAFHECGVVSAKDMTTEAVVTKLAYLLSKNLEPVDVRQAISHNIRGEISTEVDTFHVKEPTTGISSRL